MSQASQLGPLPQDLPFRIVSRTIGRGAYASIKKAIPLNDDNPVFAVKLIHKGYATSHGRISAKQIAMEVSLHSHIGQHPNIIEWFATGEDNTWRWIAMEYAEGGDLFDKIEADVGVNTDIAHLYFHQLIGGVSFMHSKGVAHRDLKPENILLSDTGNLKIADFGMATMFEYRGQTKLSSTICGSPPYVAPEVLQCTRPGNSRSRGEVRKYSAELVDIWSCGVILFVLLVGNTPWDEPTSRSWEYQEYVHSNGRSSDALWDRVPNDALSLLRGMMSIEPAKRFSFTKIRQHPWYSRSNQLMTADGKIVDPVYVATKMLEGLHIDFSIKPLSQPSDAMDVDSHISATQPEVLIADPLFDFDRPALRGMHAFSSTQPTTINSLSATQPTTSHNYAVAADVLDAEPSMSQFSQTPGVTLTLTQHARKFRDLVPAYAFTRFMSAVPPQHLIRMLTDALHNLNVPVGTVPTADLSPSAPCIAAIKIRATDGRKQSLHGEIVIEKSHVGGEFGGELLEVQFVKVKGDPLEWRRFFKKVAVLCQDGVFRPDA